MSAPRGLLGRSALLLAMAAYLPDVSNDQREVEEALHDALRWSEPGERAMALPLLQADVWATYRAEAEASQSLPTRARRPGEVARELAQHVSAWANNGRQPVVVRLEKLGQWWVRVRFLGPGSYSAEVFSVADGEEISAWMQVPLATRTAARTVGAAAARAMDADIDRAQGEAMLGRPRRGDITGSSTSGPLTPMEELSADEFTARYGIRDDLVKQPMPPEQRAKVEAWIEETLARKPGSPVSRAAWRPEDTADLAARYRGEPRWQGELALKDYFTEHPDAKVAVVGLSDRPMSGKTGLADHIIDEAYKIKTYAREEAAEMGVREAHERADMAQYAQPPCSLCGREASQTTDGRPCRGRCVLEAELARDNLRIDVDAPSRPVTFDPFKRPADTLTPAMIRRAAAVLEENAIPKGADGMYRVPRFDDPEVRAQIAEHERTGRAFSEAFAREMGHTLADIDKVTIETWSGSAPLRVGPSWVERHLRAGLTPEDMLPGPRPETEFDRAQRLAMSAPTMIRRRPVYSSTPGQIEGARRLGSFLHPAGRCTCGGGGEGTCDWCVMDRRRSAREDRPELRAEQAQRRRKKAAKKARRGWA